LSYNVKNTEGFIPDHGGCSNLSGYQKEKSFMLERCILLIDFFYRQSPKAKSLLFIAFAFVERNG